MAFCKTLLISMILGIGLSSCQVSQSGNEPGKPAPEGPLTDFHWKTFESITPDGTQMIETRRVESEQGHHVEIHARTSHGEIVVWLDAEGFPLQKVESLTRDEIPDAVWEAFGSPAPGAITKHWLLLYELELEDDDGEWEVYLDGWGNERFRSLEEDERETKLGWEALPATVSEGFLPYLGDARPKQIEREEAMGKTFYEIEWRDAQGTHEAKLFPNGEVFMWELAPSGKLPQVIVDQLQGDYPEPVFVVVYCIEENGGVPCLLADGTNFPESISSR